MSLLARAIVIFRTEDSASVRGGISSYQNFLVNLEKVERLGLVRSRKNDKARICDDPVWLSDRAPNNGGYAFSS